MTRRETNIPPTPEVMRLSDIIGISAALALIEAHGGTRLYVPRTLSEGINLPGIIGEEAAGKLIREHGGCYLKIPVARAWRTLVYRGHGQSYADIARRLGCTEGTVWRILNEHEMTTRQLDLFGSP